MTYKLFLDDIRMPPDYDEEWVIARNIEDAKWYVEARGVPNWIAFDHDLAQEHYIIGQGSNTGYDFAKWFADYVLMNEIDLPEDFNYSVHSMNPVGAKKIRDYMEEFFDHYRRHT